MGAEEGISRINGLEDVERAPRRRGGLAKLLEAVVDPVNSDYSRDTAVDCHRSWSMVQG